MNLPHPFSYDLGRIASMSELARQHIPVDGVCLQRQVLVLTNMGIHTLQKVRPADYLYRFLSQVFVVIIIINVINTSYHALSPRVIIPNLSSH